MKSQCRIEHDDTTAEKQLRQVQEDGEKRLEKAMKAIRQLCMDNDINFALALQDRFSGVQMTGRMITLPVRTVVAGAEEIAVYVVDNALADMEFRSKENGKSR